MNTSLDLSPVVDAVTDAVDKRLAQWEAANSRPRMLPLAEAADLLGVCTDVLRELAPRLPLVIDRTGRGHRVSSVLVYDIVRAGGIEVSLDVAVATPLSGDRGVATEASESPATSKAAPARKAQGVQVPLASGARSRRGAA